MQVEVEPGKTWSVVQSQDDGGKATFTIPFVRSGAQKNPRAVSNGLATTKAAAARAKKFSLASFVAKLDTSGFEDVRANILETIQYANSALVEVNGRVSGALATPTVIAGQIQSFGNNLAILIATPQRVDELADGLYSIVEAIFGVISQAGIALRDDLRQPFEKAAAAQIAARKVIGLNRQTRNQVGALNAGANQNELVIGALIGQAAAIEAARAAVDMPYDSRDSAQAASSDLSAQLASLAEVADDDDLYAALTDTRVELGKFLSRVAGDLPGVVDYTPVRTLPALLIAHRVHGDARRCEEIIARNNIKNPGFVAGGVVLKVLADA
jgi:prophage DNA circulation protein